MPKQNPIRNICVKVRPFVVLGLPPGMKELQIEVTVGNRISTFNYVLADDDEMRSRFDQLFDIAREMLRQEILG